MRSLYASLRNRLFLLVCLALLPILLLVLYANREQRQVAIHDAQQSALRLARLAASDQERLIEASRQLLITLARLPQVRDHDAAECNALFADLLRQYSPYENLGAADANGDIFCSGVPSAAWPNVADRQWFLRALYTRDFVAGDFIIARISGKPTMSTAYPVFDEEGAIRAVVFAGIDLDWLDTFVTQAQLPEGSSLTVVDHLGKILTHYPDPEEWRGESLPAAALAPLIIQGEGVAEADGLSGIPQLYGFTKLCCVPGGDIFLRVGIPQAVAFADANRTLTHNLMTIGAVTLLSLIVAGAGGYLFVLRPIDALLALIKRFDAGDFAARSGASSAIGELAQVALALDQMAATIQARESERDRSEAALRLHSARAEALATTAARLNAELDLQNVLNIVCQETAEALQVSAASVSLYDEKSDTLRCVSRFGLPPDFCQRFQGYVPCIDAAAADQREQYVIDDVKAHPELPNASIFDSLDIRSVVGTPMIHEGRMVGALCVYARGIPRRLVEDELAFLRAISGQAAQAIVNARLYQALKQEQRYRAALLHKTVSAQEEERIRIARELHDQTSQDLTALLLSLDACSMDLAAGGPRLEKHLKTAKAISQTMLTNIHRLINDLRPSLLDDLGLAPAIIWYGEKRLKPVGIELAFQCDRMDARLPPSLETELFRIAQEALTNVVRHAQATRVEVTLEVVHGRVLLTVQDDGTGFQRPAAALMEEEGRGLGLRGMEERVSTLAGELELSSAPGQGTTIRVTVPLPKEVDADGKDPRDPGR